MKSLLLLIALLGAVTFGSIWASTPTSAANTARKDRAVMTFTQPVTLMGVVLKGQYLFVHDDAAMTRGEACTFVYKGDAPVADKLVVSFHCIPAERTIAASFTVRTTLTAPGRVELTEFQFAGSTEAHLVLVNQHVDH